MGQAPPADARSTTVISNTTFSLNLSLSLPLTIPTATFGLKDRNSIVDLCTVFLTGFSYNGGLCRQDTRFIILLAKLSTVIFGLKPESRNSSDEEVTFEGYSTHFRIAEAARRFLHHEIGTVATASLLARMPCKKSKMELAFSPDIVSAVGYPIPRISKELAENC
ncbi:hypothetical protein DITRI_Ditri13aG0101200 [Diplodiscus trichospermus]